MTTKQPKEPKLTIGAELAIVPLDNKNDFWTAKIRLYELTADPERAGSVRQASNAILALVGIDVDGTDRHRETIPETLWNTDLGMDSYGTCKLFPEWVREIWPSDAIEAARMCLTIEKRMQKVAETYGRPSSVRDLLKRAILASRAQYIRTLSDYCDDKRDATKCWTLTRGPSGIDYAIRGELERFRFYLRAKRPDLFEDGKEGAA